MNDLSFQVISIHGAPRSGTSWLGQIFNSHPDVTYRHQPLFAYRFKDQLNLKSSQEEIYSFLNELYTLSDDDFILDTKRIASLPEFWEHALKNQPPAFLVMKMVRYHHLLRLFLESVPDMKIIGIIRNPCAVINSWLQAPKEFLPEWNAKEEWRYAPSKNAGRIEEFNGYEKWKELAYLFLELEQENPNRFLLTQYEHLVSRTESEVARLFSFAGLSVHPQALDFLKISTSRNDPDPYAVIKTGKTGQRWRYELDTAIVNEIYNDIQGTSLERFLI